MNAIILQNLFVMLACCVNLPDSVPEEVSTAFNFAPAWRSQDDCGVNAAYILAKLQGVNISLEEVKRKIPIVPNRGSSLLVIAQFLKNNGLDYRPNWIAPSQLQDAIEHGRPVIAQTIGGTEGESYHFTVLVSYDRDRDQFTYVDTTYGGIQSSGAKGLRSTATGYILSQPSRDSEVSGPIILLVASALIGWFTSHIGSRITFARKHLTSSARKAARTGFTLVELLVVISIIGVLVGLLLPAVQMAREAARRMECANNLKQLSLGVLNLESAHRHLPTGGWGKNWAGLPQRGVGPTQPGGWIYQVLPFVEQQTVHDLGGSGPSDAAANTQRLQTPLAVLYCPSRRSADALANPRPWSPHYHAPAKRLARNDYAFNGGSVYVRFAPGPDTLEAAQTYDWVDMRDSTGLCLQRSKIKLSDVRDGLSQTYLLGEKQLRREHYYSGEDWGDNESAYSGDDRDMIRFTGRVGEFGFEPLFDAMSLSPSHDPRGGMVFGSPHRGAFQMVMADGSIHSLSYSIDQFVHSQLGSRADGKTIPGDVLQ